MVERKVISKVIPSEAPPHDPNALVKAGAQSNHAWRNVMEDDSEIDEDNIPPYSAIGIRQPAIADKAIYDALVHDIREGVHPTVAAQAAGIHYTTFRTYLERGRSGVNKLYYAFWKDIQKAWAFAEIETLRKLRKHQDMDWRAAAWMLERQWPERYALKTISRSEVNVTGQIEHKAKEDLASKLIDDASARELARALIGNLKPQV